MRTLIKAIIAVGVVITISALVVCLVPLKEVSYLKAVDYEDIETYYEDEPYEDTETYFEDEPYEGTETYYEDEPYEGTETYYETEPLRYEVVEAFAQVEGITPVVYITLQNTDSVSGTFTVQLTLSESGITITKSSMTFWSRDYPPYDELLALQPNETKTIKYGADGIDIIRNDWDWNYSITPSTKTVEKERTVTKYRQVEKERTVTKYRQVEKERTVTKDRLVEKERTVTNQRLETQYKKVSLLDYWLLY